MQANTISNIYLVRHGLREDMVHPEWKASAVRPFDPPLSEEGLRQAEDIARALEAAGVRALYSSPFLRAVQTAAATSALMRLPVKLEPGFAEFINREWFEEVPDFLDMEDLQTHCPLIDAKYAPAHPGVELESDESVDVRGRVRRTLDTILARSEPGPVAIFTHGSPLCQATLVLLGSLDGVDTGMGAITTAGRAGESFRLIASSSAHLRDADTIRRFH